MSTMYMTQFWNLSRHPRTVLALLGAIVAVMCFSIEASAQARGPILQITNDPTDFDTVLCGTTKCRSVTFGNVGDTTLRVYSVGPIDAPFSGNVAVPFDLAPGARRTMEICYAAGSVPGIDVQTVPVRADNRVSLSIGMLFDVSSSMTAMLDASTRIQAAHDAGVDFLSGLVNAGTIQDEAAVFSFAGPGEFAVRQNFTSNRTLLQDAVPATAPGAATCLYRAIIQSSELVGARPNRRVLIVLTDGDNGCNGDAATIQSAISAANANNVTVFTIGIGGANMSSLSQIASGTGGRFFTANTRSDLIGVYRTIATLLSKDIPTSFDLRARTVSPRIVVDHTSIFFDSTRVGESRCSTVTVSNTGDAPLELATLSLPAPFTVTGLPATILPGASTTLEVCFRPERLRAQSDDLSLGNNACSQAAPVVALRGIGYDSVTIEVRDLVVAKPGSVIEIPVYLRTRVPAEYDVRDLSISVAYNKTVIYPMDQFGATAGTLSESMTGLLPTSTYSETDATTTLRLENGLVVATDENGILVRLSFRMLHGNALETPVRIVAATFADGNPRVGTMSPAIARADSLCYQADRLIDASARYNGTFKLVYAGKQVTGVQVSVPTSDVTRLYLYDALGRQMVTLLDEFRDAGEFEIPFDESNLVSGTYYLRLESSGGSAVRVIQIAR